MTEEKDVTIRQTLTRRTRAHLGEGRVPRVLPRGNRAGVDRGVSQDYLLRKARGGMTDLRAESGGDPSLVAERGGGLGRGGQGRGGRGGKPYDRQNQPRENRRDENGEIIYLIIYSKIRIHNLFCLFSK